MMLRAFYDLFQTQSSPQAADLVLRMQGAMRFVFSEHASAACIQLASNPESIERARSQIFAPFQSTWIEFAGDLDGTALLWAGVKENPIRRGTAAFIQWPNRSALPTILPLLADMERPLPLKIDPRAALRIAAAGGDGERATDLAPRFTSWLLAAFALLASTGMTRSTPYDLSRLNQQRAKRGLYPLLGYEEIRLTLDAERALRGPPVAIATGQMPLHAVRAHLRLLPSGRVTIVRPHMRGNPEYGIRGTHYDVQTTDDGVD